MRTLILTAAWIMVSSSAFALEDTPDNRATQADRYLEVQSPQAMIFDMAEQMSRSLPPERREAYIRIYRQHMDMAAITRTIRDSLIQFFTADELKALADFYGSTEGKSAMAKFGKYMAHIAPALQAETDKAMQKTLSEMRAADGATAGQSPAPPPPPPQPK